MQNSRVGNKSLRHVKKDNIRLAHISLKYHIMEVTMEHLILLQKKIFQHDSKNGNIAAISTLSGIYGKENEVPSKEAMEILERYAKVYPTEIKEPGQPILVEY